MTVLATSDPRLSVAAATPLLGLTDQEAAARRARGQGNTVKIETSRSYRDILIANAVNPIHVVLLVIGAAMVAIGRLGDAFSGVGLITFNIVIGVTQEIRAKRQLDRIALLTRPKVTALRDGQERSLDPAELVIGEIMVLRPGDQLVVDGVVVGDGRLELDESLLTGEAEAVAKGAGDAALSGSFCVSGTALVEATRVGRDSYANTLTANARKFRITHTPLQREVNLTIRLLMTLAAFIGGLDLLAALLQGVPFMRQVQMAAVIVGLVPNGLFATMIIAYALGAVRIVGHGALVQQANAVESLSNVTVLCTDKTGTLTANKIAYHALYAPGQPEGVVERRLGDFAASLATANKTAEALLAALPGSRRAVLDEVPFASKRKWSGLVFDDATYVLGAPEMLSERLTLSEGAQAQLQAWSAQGLRVLAFGHNPAAASLHGADGEPRLPDLAPLGLVCFSDELRPQLKETLAAFARNGVALKIISGDNPQAVAALAQQAGWSGNTKAVSGLELAGLTPAEFKQAAAETSIFGRITPEQKEQLVGALREQGHYVAMIGDGVNDVLSLKKADLGIAMQSGSAAARGVANLVLLGDSFGALPFAFTEGQRIVNGMKDILRLYLSRVLFTALLLVATTAVGTGAPLVPKQSALISFFAVGLPTLALAIWARPGPLPRRSLLREVAPFVLPAGASIFVVGLIVYLTAYYASLAGQLDVVVTPEAIASLREFAGINYAIPDSQTYLHEVSLLAAQTALATFLIFAGLLLLVFVEPPNRWWVAGEALSGDWRPAILAGVLFVAYLVIVLIPPFSAAFELSTLPAWGYGLIGLVTLAWMLTLRIVWRRHWLERWLGRRF